MEISEIESKIACGELSADQVFTQMKQHTCKNDCLPRNDEGVPIVQLGAGDVIIGDTYATDGSFSGVSFTKCDICDIGSAHHETFGKTNGEIGSFLAIMATKPESLQVLIDKLTLARDNFGIKHPSDVKKQGSSDIMRAPENNQAKRIERLIMACIKWSDDIDLLVSVNGCEVSDMIGGQDGELGRIYTLTKKIEVDREQ